MIEFGLEMAQALNLSLEISIQTKRRGPIRLGEETTLSSIHAQVCGCRVLMENHKANQERALDEVYLYQPDNLNEAASRLRKLVEEYDFSRRFPNEAWLKRFDYNWQIKKLLGLMDH